MNESVFSNSFVRGVQIVFLSAALWAALISFASAESITSFSAKYTIDENNQVTVHERIVYDFGQLDRRGIFREVLPHHPQKSSAWYKERYVDISVVSVERNGAPERYVNESSDGLFLRIGNPAVYITGEHTYDIVYTLDGALSQYSDGLIELYWNVTGSDWSIPIENISVAVSGGAQDFTPQSACYIGVAGSNQRCASSERVVDQGELITQFTHNRLSPGQQITIAHEVRPLSPVVPLERVRWTFILPFLAALLAAAGGWGIYRWRTHHSLNQAVIARYTPYKHFRPMFTGVLFDSRLDPHDITAGIVYLAQQGFIRIKQTKETVLYLFDTHDYEVTLLRPIEEVKDEFQIALLELIFLGQKGFLELEPGFTELSSLAGLEVGKTVSLSSIRTNESKRMINARIIRRLKKAVSKDMRDYGFLERKKINTWKFTSFGLFPFAFIVLLYVFPDWASGLFSNAGDIVVPIVFTFVIGLMIAFVVYGLTRERRTRKGYEALHHLKGFKDYLATTEKDRYKFHNAPDKSPQEFMQYLPFAIAFGVEEEWAEVFKDIHIDNPDWYDSELSGSNFSAVSFGNELNAFSSSFTSSTGPTSSGGSSGGGFSGGGGGGGGGGSW